MILHQIHYLVIPAKLKYPLYKFNFFTTQSIYYASFISPAITATKSTIGKNISFAINLSMMLSPAFTI
jgi:hypothetical protein